MNELKKKGIITQVHYIPVTMHPFYKKLGYNITEKSNLLYGKIQHYRMQKII